MLQCNDLDEAFELHCAALELRPSGHPERHCSLLELACCFSSRYDNLGVAADLEDAVTLGREALALCPPGHPWRGASLTNLAIDLQKRFKKRAMMPLELCPSGYPERHRSLCELASCFLRRYGNLGVAADLEEAITLDREALALCPPGHPWRGKRFKKHATMHDLDEAFKLNHAALELRPSGHPERHRSLCELASCFLSRYGNLGVAADLEEAVTLDREALALCPPGHPWRGASLTNLAIGLQKRFKKHATMHDLDEAFELNRAALELCPSGHPERHHSLCELASCFLSRYDNLGVAADLEEAVTLHREALALCPPGHPGHGRFKKHATIHDLDEAFELNCAALELLPSEHPDRHRSLCELACCFSSRYDNLGVVADFEEAIKFSRAALALCPLGHSHRIKCLHAVALMPGSGMAKYKVHAAFSFHALSLHLWDTYQKQPAIADLDAAICLAMHALELRLPKHHDYAASRVRRLVQGTGSDESVMLGHVVDSLCALGCAIADLDEAIALYRYALQLRPAGHPKSPGPVYSRRPKLWHIPGLSCNISPNEDQPTGYEGILHSMGRHGIRG
ncbi:TPR-like protein [Pisolithus croceorrhizus]|nr:TPR-like protein [Pisolithus croceorrhizus]